MEVVVEPTRNLRLKELREERGLSQTRFAGIAGLNPTTVNQIERGTRQPSARTLAKLASALGVSVPDLFVEEAVTPKTSAPPSPVAPEEDAGEEWRTRPFDMVHELVTRQIEEDRQAMARAAESGHAQGSFVRHENEAFNRLLEYPPGEVAEAYVDLMRHVVQLETSRASSAGADVDFEQYLAAVQEWFQKAHDKGTAPLPRTRAQGT
jgi:transcriptional regulator with XRE-family HTH domain